MTSTQRYLSELDRLLAPASPAVREELLAGIREELNGLDAATAVARMRELGDPARIAAEALADTPVDSAGTPRDSVWYSLVAVVLMAIGGWIVPIVGGIVGLIMLWASAGWTLRHKIVGTLATLASPAAVALLVLPYSAEGSVVVGADDGMGGDTDGVNPLIPASPDWANLPLFAVVVFVALLVFWLGGMLWLLGVSGRARRR